MILHTPTLFVVIVALSAVLAVAIAIIGHRRHADLSLWSAALACHSAAFALYGLRGQVSDALSVVGGNLMLGTTLALFGEGIYRFQRREPPRWLLWPPVAVIAVCFSLLLDDVHARLVLGGIVWSLQCLFIVVPIAQKRRETAGRGQYILATGVLLAAGVLVFRALAVTIGGVHVTTFTESGAMQGYTFLVSTIGLLCCALGLLTMNQELAEQAAETATAELRRSEEHYRLLVDSANEGICVIEGAVLRFVNPKCLELLGYEESEVRGRHTADFIHEDDRKLALRNYQRRLSGQADDLRYPVRMLTKHRGVRWFEVSGTRFDWQGRPATLNFLTDITDRKMLDERIRDLAYHDELTDLPNRRLLMDQLRLALAGNRRSGRRGALLFVDLDNFKPLNDAHGHGVGDLLLLQVAERLRTTLRESDFVARFGGDEFVALLGQLDADEATARTQALGIAEKVRSALAATYRLTVRHTGAAETIVEHHCTASIGVVVFLAPPGSEGRVLSQADAAMYEAKQSGRNAICFADLGALSGTEPVAAE